MEAPPVIDLASHRPEIPRKLTSTDFIFSLFGSFGLPLLCALIPANFRPRTMTTTNERYQRTEQDVHKVIQLAKLDEAELNRITQVLQFAPNSNDISDIKFLEVDTHLLETLKEGDCLSFQGDETESMVLCSKSRTYDIKEAETSNSLLLIPKLKFAKETAIRDCSDRVLRDEDVRGVFYTYYEVRPCKPRLGKLLKILEPSAFKGVEYESDVDQSSLYSWDRLLGEMQASEDELRQALADHVIVNINGYLRHVTFEYEARALTLMLDLIEENSWEMDEVDKETTCSLLHELIPKAIIEAVFEAYTEPSGKKNDSGDLLYRYNEERTCRFLAKVLLSASPKNEYNEFMDAWRIGTPRRMEPKSEWLSGLALIVFNKGRNMKEVISYPESDLPDDIIQRFNELFKVKEKWTLEEISPYIQNVTTDKMNVNALLTKHSRCSMTNGVKYYCAKHCK